MPKAVVTLGDPTQRSEGYEWSKQRDVFRIGSVEFQTLEVCGTNCKLVLKKSNLVFFKA